MGPVTVRVARTLALTLSCAACAGEALEPVTGALEVTVHGGGDGGDPDGFVALVDGLAQRSLAAGQVALFAGLSAGSHQVSLGGVGANCALTGAATQEVNVVPGDTAGVAFDVTCAAVTGTLRVAVTTSGTDLDPNGYDVLVDGAPGSAVEPDGAILFPVPAGDHTVTLGALNRNCAVDVPEPRQVRVAAGGLSTAEFAVQCAAGARAGRGHEIALVRREPEGAGRVIYVVNDDGTHQERLFPALSPPQDTPAWAPDGNRIAFYTLPTDSTAAVMIGDAGGAILRQFEQTNNLESFDLAWSPDGTRLALEKFFLGSCPVIRLLPVNGSAESTLDPGCFFDGEFESFTWSPDGGRLAFVVSVITNIDTLDEFGILGIVDLSKPGESERLPEGCQAGSVGEVDWSPDGTRLAFTDHGIAVLDFATSSCVHLTDDPSDRSPTWSPDSRRLAFSSARDGNAEIYLIGADGIGLTRITRNSVDDVTPSWRP